MEVETLARERRAGGELVWSAGERERVRRSESNGCACRLFAGAWPTVRELSGALRATTELETGPADAHPCAHPILRRPDGDGGSVPRFPFACFRPSAK
jgi:hypothetical protein